MTLGAIMEGGHAVWNGGSLSSISFELGVWLEWVLLVDPTVNGVWILT